MAALRLVRRWGIPLATATSAPLLVPVVRAEAGDAKEEAPAPPPPPTSRMVRPSDLPIYEEPEEVLNFEYHGRERTTLEEGVGVVRQQVEGVLAATRSTRERAVHIYETGKAHSMAALDILDTIRDSTATVDYLADEENTLPRVGAITVGGLAGWCWGLGRGGLFKKILYTSTGVITAASLCYPRHAYTISQQLYGGAKTYGAIGYNFVAGVKPQSKAPPPPPPAEETPKEAEKEEDASASAGDSADTPKPEGGEVRSAVVLSLPPGKTLVDTLAEQASDVTVWGFRLTDDTTAPPKPAVPEGFGTIGTGQVATAVVAGQDEAQAPREVVEKVKEGAAIVEEKLPEVEKKVEEALGVVERVDSAAAAAAEVFPGVPEAVVEQVETLVEETQAVVESVTTAVSQVEKVAEEMKQEAHKVEEEAAQLVESEEKRKEVAEEVVEIVEQVVNKQADETPGSTPAVEEARTEVDASPAAAPAPLPAPTKDREGLFDKLVNFLAKNRKDSAKQGEAPQVPAEMPDSAKQIEGRVAAAEEKLSEVEQVVEVVEEGMAAVAEKVKEVEKAASSVAVKVLSPVLGKEEVEEALGVVERVGGAALAAAEVFPGVPEATVERMEATVEETQAVVESVTTTASQAVEEQADTPPEAAAVVAVEVEGGRRGHSIEREGLFDKLVTFLSRPSKDARDSAAQEKTDPEVDSGVPQTPLLVEEKPTSGTGDDTLTEEAVEVVKEVVEATSVVEEVVEVVKEGAAAVGEKLVEVEEQLVEVVEKGVAAVGEKLVEVEEQWCGGGAEPCVGEGGGIRSGGEVEEAVEAAAVVVEEAASLVEKVVEETQAAVESVNETASEVEGVVEQVTQVVEGKEGLFDKLVNLLSKPGQDDTQSGKAVEGTPGMPDSAKEVEAAPQVVDEAVQSSKVEGVVEVVKEDIQKVEEEATQVVESKEVDLSVVKKQPGVEDQVESTPAATPEGQAEVEAIPATPVVSPLEEREGLFDKLVSLFSKDAGQEKAAPPPVTEATHTTGEVEAAPQAAAEMPDTARELQETQVDTAPPTEADAVPPMPVQEAPAEVDAASPPAVQEAPAAAEEATSPATAPLVPQAEESEGLFDKLISFLSKDSKDASAAEVPDSAKQVEAAGESTSEVPDSAKQVEAAGEVTESAKEDLSGGEGEDEFVIVSSMGEASDVMDVLKPDSVLDKLRPTEPHLESTPAKAEVTPATTEASRTGDEKEQVAAMPVVEVETKAPEVRVTEEEGLFDKLVRLFTKDEERPASSSATVPSPDSAGGGGVSTEPVPGEGGEAALPAAPGDVDTAQHQDVLEVAEHAAPIPDVLTVPSDTTQVPDAPPPPQHTTPAPAVPVGTAGTEPEETEGTLLEEPTPESPAPPPIKKVALLDKLSSLFQKEEPHPLTPPQLPHRNPPAGERRTRLVQQCRRQALLLLGIVLHHHLRQGSGGGEEAADSVAASGGKEEEEAALPAAEDTAAAQPQVSAPQVQSSSVVGAVEVSGEAAKDETAAIPSMPQGVQGQAESREASTQTQSIVPVTATQPATDTDSAAVSRVADGPVSITSEEDTFIVRASPNRPSQTEVQGDHGRPGSRAGAAVQPRWSATEAVVVEEGKDTIVQLTPPGPEKDYGQSSPEDSDMYTTRG
ncbi:LOW QUALITY PROTEIN: microtubule-associated protein futsch-like [Portunus trituberculatus]|uniref:LOW QUALITY PROTEIN: microtubule-associated protein futsch-like n=1 Tax=Portunus trituberculatus TaxID=210409 RepID=UPI001E1CC83C|nr:LOW QUALITY PROTEIN: microtubule-associated protein futsch-like [Portunus trituberculatus]